MGQEEEKQSGDCGMKYVYVKSGKGSAAAIYSTFLTLIHLLESTRTCANKIAGMVQVDSFWEASTWGGEEMLPYLEETSGAHPMLQHVFWWPGCTVWGWDVSIKLGCYLYSILSPQINHSLQEPT